MSLIQTISNIIKKDILITGNPIIIKEVNKNAIGRFVELIPPRKSVAFSIENHIVDMFPFFSLNPPEGYRKVADGIIFFEDKNKNFVLIAELKSGGDDKAKKQIRSTAIFVDYLLELIKLHSGETYNLKKIFCIFKEIRAPKKRGTRRELKEFFTYQANNSYDLIEDFANRI